jgi:hypothetical protein
MNEITGRQGSALKHGGYSKAIVLPGEDPEVFEAQYQGLREEWEPQGTLEENFVLALAKLMLQKNRVDDYFYQEMILLRRTKEDEIDQASQILPWLERATTVDQAKTIIYFLPRTYIRDMGYLRDAGGGIIASEFRPAEKEIPRLANRLRELINMQKEIEVSPYEADNSAKMRELTAQKTAIDDRLDSSIDKTIKRLALIKTFKLANAAQNSAAKTVDHGPAVRLLDKPEHREGTISPSEQQEESE